jgi:hypothetical protein
MQKYESGFFFNLQKHKQFLQKIYKKDGLKIIAYFS